MKRHARTSSAGLTMRQGSRLGRIVHGAFAFRASSPRADGSGAPSSGHSTTAPSHAQVGSVRPAAVLFLAAAVLAAAVLFGTTALAAAVAPTVATEPATHVTSETAYLEATVNPNSEATKYWFEYGETASYGTRAPALVVKEGETQAEAEANYEGLAAGEGTEALLEAKYAGGLSPSTTYHFRVVAENASGKEAGLDETFTTLAEPGLESCENEQRREEEHAAFLPDCRAYELVSPKDKNGSDILAIRSRTRAAAAESPGLPAAVTFSSFVGFGDLLSSAAGPEYFAERTAAPATQGWSTHSIEPPGQESGSMITGLEGLEPHYVGEMSPDLTKGVFSAFTLLTAAPNLAPSSHQSLYLREDLRTPGAGSYQLISNANQPVPPAQFFSNPFARVAGTSTDFSHILFQDRLPLRATADGLNGSKLYVSDGSSTVPRLILAGPNCGFQFPSKPCSAPGHTVQGFETPERVISSDGSRVDFADPVNPNNGYTVSTPGAATRLFQADDNGTPTTADNALIQLNASEASSPGFTQFAMFQTASADGSRVFFESPEELIDGASGGGLYMWQRAEQNQVQRLAVDASGGTFTVTAHTQPTIGRGDITENSTEVTSTNAGSFMDGQTVSGPGIPAGTQVKEMKSGSKLILTQPATASTSGATIHADVEATTPPLPFDATAAQVQSALEALATTPAAPEEARRLIGEGNVKVTGGPGSPGASTPYEIEFTGALNGVDFQPLTADPSGLSGGASSATVTVANPVHNLSLIAETEGGSGSADRTVLGASPDGHHLYFYAYGQLVPGAPPVNGAGIYYWQDAEGPPAGTLSFVGGLPYQIGSNLVGANFLGAGRTSRVTPDGRELVFQSPDGTGLAPHYDSSECHADSPTSGAGCAEIYVYRAEGSTPTKPNLTCASCNPSGAPATTSAWLAEDFASGGVNESNHINQAVSDNGRYVFFSTKEALVSEDTNGTYDAYEYDTRTETVHLLSSGTDSQPSYFLDASADGHDVYIATRQKLVGWDGDDAYDLYDARIGGGFPEPPPVIAPCNGDSCRAAIPAAPAAPSVGSAHEGPGNLKPKQSRCPKGRRLSKGRCVARKHRGKHHKSNHRSARANRRAAK